MNVVVDTPVWSLALRRSRQHLSSEEAGFRRALAELIRESRVLMIGPIRQELLSGIREEAQFVRLRDELRAFKDIEIQTPHYEFAAQMSNICRSRGVATSPVDMLICAIAQQLGAAIFTTDRDYEHYSKVLGVRLFTPDSGPRA